MTVRNLILIHFIALLAVLTSCEDANKRSTPELDGLYTGIFTVEYKDGQLRSNEVTVAFDGNTYSSSTGADRIPAGGSGTFSVKENTITFSDENIWTADFDWNLILNGTYTYSSNGKELVLSADKNEVGSYRYELHKE